MPTTRIPGFVLTDHVVELPLDHAAPDDGRTIEVFAREVVAPGSKVTVTMGTTTSGLAATRQSHHLATSRSLHVRLRVSRDNVDCSI